MSINEKSGWTVLKVPRSVAQWILTEAARRTAKTGERVALSTITTEAVNFYRAFIEKQASCEKRPDAVPDKEPA